MLCSDINCALKAAVTKLDMKQHGFQVAQISSHSLQAGGAMGHHLNNVPTHLIQKMGRWSSDTLLVYIHEQITVFSTGLSTAMGKNLLIPKPCSAQTDNPVYKQKLTPAIQTPFPIDNTPRKKQCIIHDLYGANSWYNTPATTHNFQSLTTNESQTLSLALNKTLSTAMSFNPLHDDAYFEIATGLLASTSLPISKTVPHYMSWTHFWIGREHNNLQTNQQQNGKSYRSSIIPSTWQSNYRFRR
jgi:hypothetical protein